MVCPERSLVLLVLLVGALHAVAGPASELSATAPPKPAISQPPVPPADVRQGGDTIADAVPLDLPVVNQTGTTSGYTNDYDEICPYSGSTAPDVVYTFTPAQTIDLIIDMVGSAYDTKIYVYDQGLELVACNDDFYSDYTSRIENLQVVAGVRYYLVIDGYGNAAGAYLLNVSEYVPCEIDYVWDAQDEGGPPITDDYQDSWNGGCNCPEFGNPFQPITHSVFIGRAGWYLGASGSQSRDTDWLTLVVPAGGVLEITGDAEYASYMFELGPQDCSSVAVIQNVPIGPCSEATMTIIGTPGATVWFWVGSQTFAIPDGFIGHEYYYVLSLNLLTPVETHTFTEIKAMFR